MASASRKGKVNSKKTILTSYPHIDKKLSDLAMISTIEKLKSSPRTAGDGMERVEESEPKPTQRQDSETGSEIPQQVKRKEPKFVPYEPYRAAVTPILSPEAEQKNLKHSFLKETHIPFPLVDVVNPELISASQIPVMKVLRDAKVPELCHSNNAIIVDATAYHIEREEWQSEKMKLEQDIRQLRNEKRDIENQFKIQTQVNKELKKLLVASMGEDMQSRVQFLSEDKARLAQDISRYSQRLLEDNEELERRAIHCDVWRSKFLACSLMVDELAGWKAVLSRNFEEAKEALSWLFEDRRELKQHQLVLHRTLRQLQDAFDPSASRGPKSLHSTPSTLLGVSQGNRQLAEAIHFRLLGSVVSGIGFVNDGWNCDQQTPAEELAQKVLSSKDVCLENLSALDDIRSRHKICRLHALGEQMTMNCCRHCLGEINVV